MKRNKLVTTILLLGLCTLLWKLFSHSPLTERECRITDGGCRAGYLLNLDGMKGLGHSALLLIDEEGSGKVFSYNGMQYNLAECLAGREGVGKMMEYTLEPQEVECLLRTGNLEAGSCEECDNFDRILYRCVSGEQYEQIVCSAEYYIDIGTQYEQLYANVHDAEEEMRPEAEAEMERFLEQDLPRYQIYTHNCDTVARELLALVDEEISQYNDEDQKLTPKENYKNMCRTLSDLWGITRLGEDSMVERVLDF